MRVEPAGEACVKLAKGVVYRTPALRVAPPQNKSTNLFTTIFHASILRFTCAARAQCNARLSSRPQRLANAGHLAALSLDLQVARVAGAGVFGWRQADQYRCTVVAQATGGSHDDQSGQS